jgi:DNA-binding CsgD family transcriptional regulator
MLPMEWAGALNLLEAAYRLDGADSDWMQGAVERVGEIAGRENAGAGGFAATGRIDPEGHTVLADVTLGTFMNCDGDGRRAVLAAMLAYPGSLPPAIQEKAFFSSVTASTASVVTGLGATLDQGPAWKMSGLEGLGAKDAFFLACHDGPLGSVVLFNSLSGIRTLKPAEVRLCQRVATHVGAAFRLRRNVDATPDRAEAVLSPHGRVEHLVRAEDRTGVKDGFARRRHARRRNTKPEAALEIWQGLHDGRWSLVDYVDTDRKAFVLAVRNEPARDVASTLTDRQRAAVALASLGYANKQIAYALGLSATAVAMLLARARAATGVRTRAELVRAFKRDLSMPARQVQ